MENVAIERTPGGLFVPYHVGEDGVVTYWPDGYPTEAAAWAAVDASESGCDNPPGVPVSCDTGRALDLDPIR